MRLEYEKLELQLLLKESSSLSKNLFFYGFEWTNCSSKSKTVGGNKCNLVKFPEI